MAESIGYKLYRWEENKMSYLSCSLQLHLKCDDKRLKEYLHMHMCTPGRTAFLFK